MPVELLEKLPKRAASLWEATYQSAKEKYGESRAAKIAWVAVKKKFKKVDDVWVAKYIIPNEYTTVRYVFTADSDNVSKSSDGFIYRDYVLSSNSKDKHNQSFSDFALKRMAEQINMEKLRGRATNYHTLWKKLIEQGLSPDEVEQKLQEEDTGIQAISAKFENGKLIARVKFTPEAFEQAKDIKGASIEARLPKESYRAGVFHQARLQGFVLTNEPANPDAVAL